MALDTPVPWKTWLEAGATGGEQVCGEQTTVGGRPLYKLPSKYA